MVGVARHAKATPEVILGETQNNCRNLHALKILSVTLATE
jgi:hypothetical protein